MPRRRWKSKEKRSCWTSSRVSATTSVPSSRRPTSIPVVRSSSAAKSGQRRCACRFSASRASSLGSVSTPAASMPAAAQLAPRPASPRSNRSTVQPRAASRQPTPRPTTPPPMMAMRRPEAVETEAVEGVSIGASVRWHYPAHVRWVCSQPAPRGWASTPAQSVNLRSRTENARALVIGGRRVRLTPRRGFVIASGRHPHDRIARGPRISTGQRRSAEGCRRRRAGRQDAAAGARRGIEGGFWAATRPAAPAGRRPVRHRLVRARGAGHDGGGRHADGRDRGAARRQPSATGLRAGGLWRAAWRRAGPGHDRRRARLQPLRPPADQGRRGARPFSGRPGGHRPRRADQGGRPGGQERHRLRSVQAFGRQLRHARGHDRGFRQGAARCRGDANPAACRAGARGRPWRPAGGDGERVRRLRLRPTCPRRRRRAPRRCRRLEPASPPCASRAPARRFAIAPMR